MGLGLDVVAGVAVGVAVGSRSVQATAKANRAKTMSSSSLYRIALRHRQRACRRFTNARNSGPSHAEARTQSTFEARLLLAV